MTAKSHPRLAPSLIRWSQNSGTVSTVLYNWPIFLGLFLFGLATTLAGSLVGAVWGGLLIAAGTGAFLMILSIIIASFVVYDLGPKKEYDRLVELVDLSQANVVVDLTCGKTRGTQGLLSRYGAGHYMVLDIYDPAKMTDAALGRARKMSPPLEADRRIYQRQAKLDSLPIPPNWADIIYCNFSLHEITDPADRQQVFDQCARILKPNGKLLLAEHGRDWFNLLTFGPGALSFFSPNCWQTHMTEAGLEVKHHERWRGLVHLWVAERKVSCNYSASRSSFGFVQDKLR